MGGKPISGADDVRMDNPPSNDLLELHLISNSSLF
jgi:hypothetical protein